MKITDQIENAAYHEAGHAVMAYQVDWWVRYVEIYGIKNGKKDYTALTRYSLYDDSGRALLINCAGWLSEWKNDNGGEKLKPQDHLDFVYDEVQSLLYYDEDDIINCGDDGSSIFRIIKDFPNFSEVQVIKYYRKCELEAWGILENPEVWSKVEKLAKALLEKGKIEKNEVEKIICS